MKIILIKQSKLSQKVKSLIGKQSHIRGIVKGISAKHIEKSIYSEILFSAIHDSSWPSFTKVIAWILAFACIGGGSFMVFAFGVTFGNDKTYQWVLSIITSLFTSIFVIQPTTVKHF